jgi:hypothetical protein
MRGINGALTAGASPPEALRTVVSAFKNCLVSVGHRKSEKPPWTIQTFICDKRSYTDAIFNWDPVPVGVSSVFTNANNKLSLKLNGGLVEDRR